MFSAAKDRLQTRLSAIKASLPRPSGTSQFGGEGLESLDLPPSGGTEVDEDMAPMGLVGKHDDDLYLAARRRFVSCTDL